VNTLVTFYRISHLVQEERAGLFSSKACPQHSPCAAQVPFLNVPVKMQNMAQPFNKIPARSSSRQLRKNCCH